MVTDMRLLRSILVMNAAAGLIGCLLTVSLHHAGPAQILTPLVRSLATAFPVVTLTVLVVDRYGRRLYGLRFPLNWILLVAVILAAAAAGNLAYNAAAVALGILHPAWFWESFWARSRLTAIMALALGIGAFGYWMLRSERDAATRKLRQQQLDQERAAKLAAEAQLASLESHVRPHFLFNTLNTISSLIPEDPKLAENLVGKLARLLRLSLDSNQQRVGSLERELKIVNDYLQIECARHGDRLRFQIDVPPDLLPVEVPVLSLQTLVENSVKYAVGSRFAGAQIRIAAFEKDGSVIVQVADDGPGFTSAAILPGHGLDNLRQRLAALFGPEAALEISGDPGRQAVSFRVPMAARTA